jgi:hypothetical protein
MRRHRCDSGSRALRHAASRFGPSRWPRPRRCRHGGRDVRVRAEAARSAVPRRSRSWDRTTSRLRAAGPPPPSSRQLAAGRRPLLARLMGSRLMGPRPLLARLTGSLDHPVAVSSSLLPFLSCCPPVSGIAPERRPKRRPSPFPARVLVVRLPLRLRRYLRLSPDSHREPVMRPISSRARPSSLPRRDTSTSWPTRTGTRRPSPRIAMAAKVRCRPVLPTAEKAPPCGDVMRLYTLVPCRVQRSPRSCPESIRRSGHGARSRLARQPCRRRGVE